MSTGAPERGHAPPVLARARSACTYSAIACTSRRAWRCWRVGSCALSSNTSPQTGIAAVPWARTVRRPSMTFMSSARPRSAAVRSDGGGDSAPAAGPSPFPPTPWQAAQYCSYIAAAWRGTAGSRAQPVRSSPSAASSRAMAAGISAEQHGQRLGRAERESRDGRGRRGGIEVEVREAIEHRIECEARLEPREVIAEAVVTAEPEGQVVVGAAVEVELVRTLVVLLVAVGRRDDDGDRLVGGDGDAAELDLPVGLPGDHQDGRLPAQRLLDHPRDQRPVRPHALPAVALGEEREQHVADEPERGLGARRDQEAEEADDVIVAQALAVDRPGDQRADDVAGRVTAALGDDRQQVLAHRGRGGVAARVVACESDNVDRPLLELRVVAAR